MSIYREVTANTQSSGWSQRLPGTCPSWWDHRHCPGLLWQWWRSARICNLHQIWRIPQTCSSCWKPRWIWTGEYCCVHVCVNFPNLKLTNKHFVHFWLVAVLFFSSFSTYSETLVLMLTTSSTNSITSLNYLNSPQESTHTGV